jgi:hypothetical protein
MSLPCNQRSQSHGSSWILLEVFKGPWEKKNTKRQHNLQMGDTHYLVLGTKICT